MSDDFKLKKPRQNEEGGWAMTLADMMTLLLCFFVILLSIADIDQHKYENVSESLAEAMGVDVQGQAAQGQVGSSARMSVSGNQRNLFEMQIAMARLVGRQPEAVQIKMRPDSVAIVLRGAFFFTSGKADLTPEAIKILNKVAPALAKSPYDVVVEGHSDNIPMKSAQFPSNWELSSARASAVARYLLKNGFSKDRIKVMGLADTAPLYPNVDENGKALPRNQKQNRRVTLVVYPPKEAPGAR